MENNRILVFGSSPQDAPENVKFEKIYASNASIIKCENFTKLNNNVEIISVTTLDSILFDDPTKKCMMPLYLMTASPSKLATVSTIELQI